ERHGGPAAARGVRARRRADPADVHGHGAQGPVRRRRAGLPGDPGERALPGDEPAGRGCRAGLPEEGPTMPGQPAARIEDLIDHSGAMAGVFFGAMIGIALGALTVLTGGSALVVVAAVAASGAGVGLAGGGIGELLFPRQITGQIITGSRTLFIRPPSPHPPP